MNNHPPIITDVDPCADQLFPPSGSWSKFAYYSARYGWIHALCSYIGRIWLRVWLWLGPVVTRRYLLRWLASPGPHVLNLGSGSCLSNQWLAADITPRADVFMDLMKTLPLPDASVDGVYSEEVIEHIDQPAGCKMLAECIRVLKPGGTLRLTTPSLNYFAKQVLFDPIAIQKINDIFYCHGHRFIYSEEFLRQALSETGFSNVRQSSYRDANSKYGSFDSHPVRFPLGPAEWSQYWEADKPVNAVQAEKGRCV